MLFAIRDDDTNYFTAPEELEACYGRIWDACPVSLSIVPFHACTPSGAIPPACWSGESVFPIGNNRELVHSLRQLLRQGRIGIGLHGYSHRDEAQGFEYQQAGELEGKTAAGKRYLEELFGVPVRVFVPPHNALSRRGYRAVVSNGLSVCGHCGWRSRPPSWQALRNSATRRLWRAFTGHKYPFLLGCGAQAEIGYCGLTPAVKVSELLAEFEHARRHDGIFCLSTHYWEFTAARPGGGTMGQTFREFWARVRATPGVRFLTLAAMAGRS